MIDDRKFFSCQNMFTAPNAFDRPTRFQNISRLDRILVFLEWLDKWLHSKQYVMDK